MLLAGTLFPATHTAQTFMDDFSDGDFTSNPEWFGDLGIYIVNPALEMQLMDTDANTSYMYAPVSVLDSTVWEFNFRMEFAPSGSNRLKIYLQSNSPALDADLNGYFIQIGESGSDDNLDLRRQDGGSSTSILEGTLGAVASEPAEARVRVVRDNAGNWTLFADYSGGTNFVNEGTAFDDTYPSGNYFGFNCTYTSSRAEHFFFDNINISPLFQDMVPPVLANAQAVSATTVDVQFDEALDASSAENAANYSLNNGVNITGASLDGSDPTLVHLTTSAMTSGQSYTLTTNNVADVAGNPSGSQTFNFSYWQTGGGNAFDILINEIFADYSPVVGLPEAEYVELYNRSDNAINLFEYVFSDRTGDVVLPEYVLPPNEYVILCDIDNENLFTPYGNVLAVDGMPGLNNGDDDLSLISPGGTVIHSAFYTLDWLQDDTKEEGGWSYELINPNLFCEGETNWRASINPEGGTPGSQNSVYEDVEDTDPPVLLGATAIGNNQIRIVFNELVDESAEILSNYSLSGGAGAIQNAEREAPDFTSVVLTIGAPLFQDAQSYTLTINGVTDCVGNGLTNGTANFTYYDSEPASRYDILINEIFPDPSPSLGLPEQEFLELYNRSNKVINLEGFILKDRSGDVILPFHLLLPGEYVILYEDGMNSFGAYGDTLALPTFIGLGNEDDDLELLNPAGDLIHAVYYSIKWYRNTSKDDGGWTLELINPNSPCEGSDNWRASDNATGGTPGRENSILVSDPDETVPDLLRAFPVSGNSVRLFFSEAMETVSVTTPANYSIDGFTVTNVTHEGPLYNTVVLTLDNNLQVGELYEVTTTSEVTDCIGNTIGMMNSAQFAIPETIETGNVIINEILTNPETGGVDFVELYNNSNKVLNVGDLNLANKEDGSIALAEAVEFDYLLLPGAYVVLTENPDDIRTRYICENPDAFVTTGLPTYDDKEGTVVIYTPELLGEKIIDEFNYTQDYHYPLIDDLNGVSLERIDPNAETGAASNWQSAAEKVGFATPTYQNSMFVGNIIDGSEVIDIPETTFSPDGDGFEDVLLINYATEGAGYTANVRIYDAKGREVKNLIRSELLAPQGSFKWDGTTDNQEKARLGIYVVWVELFNPSGNVEYFKKACVVAGQF